MHEEADGREELRFLDQVARAGSRRTFMKWGGVALAVAAVGTAACGDDDNGPEDGTVDLGTGDTAVLNYAYALEQLEAAFYTQVVASPFAGMTAPETAILTDIRNHEVAHRDFFKAALAANAIADLEVDFTSVNFADRASVLGTARTFEDLGVSAYNGAGRLLTDASLLLVAGKIVSVEARHAAAIRDLLQPKSAAFAGDDVVDAQGLDVVNAPSAVLTAADPFVTTTITSSLA
jgi:hypothetical protein